MGQLFLMSFWLQEMGSTHPVLRGFTEIGQGAKMCLTTRHLGICDNKGQGMLIINNYELLRLYFISVSMIKLRKLFCALTC